jgi:sugar lactone lactonase YvrE
VVVGSGSGGFQSFTGDGGQATAAQLSCPLGLAFDAAGDLVVVDHLHGRVRMVDTSDVIKTVVGGGGAVDIGGPATGVALNDPSSVAFDSLGDLYLTDRSDRIFRVDGTGSISVFAGTGVAGFSGDDGPATAAQLDDPAGLAFDRNGNLLVADSNNNRVRRIDRSGIITTVAGTGSSASTGDGGPATRATLADPESVAIDQAGDVYVGEAEGNRVRRIDTTGIISTYAGIGDLGYSGDGGPAVAAQLNAAGGAFGLAVDAQGNLYIADSSNNAVRVVDATGIIRTYAGR